MRDSEYDRFGPWVIEISELDPPPPLFLPFLTREETPLLSIKIPRKIDRRSAHPGMNLYDYIVTLYEEDLVILKRVEDDVDSKTFRCRDVQHLQYGEHLLKGNLYLSMAGQDYDLPFNTVSSDIMRRLVDLIRQRYVGQANNLPIDTYPDEPESELSFFFTRLWEREKAQSPNTRILAAQIETAVGLQETSILRKLLFGIISKRLLESIHVSDGRELKIISRGKTYRYRGQAIHGTDTFYIPLNHIVGATWEPDPKNASILNLFLETTSARIPFSFIQDNPTIQAYKRFLAAVS